LPPLARRRSFGAALVTARGPQSNFKESGSPTAPVTCELFTDYECSHCAAFYLQTVPQISARYVDSGKVRLIHRDLPLANHRYARLAALYADAYDTSACVTRLAS
jgi:protein-disulfide isomerase